MTGKLCMLVPITEAMGIAAQPLYLVHFHLNLHVNLELPGQVDPGFLFNVCRYQPAN